MTRHFPIVFEREASGAVSAYVPGLPVYAAADTPAQAERAIRTVLSAYLVAHPTAQPDVQVRIAKVSDKPAAKIAVVGVAALVGATRTAAKARTARANGRLGGRPRSRKTSRTSKAER